ncbi:hypothetical protein [Klebsiella variicola]|uniref:hypothetical protein n=1 Tax=Klebsiella variicola TaxID=244366 RepID=UPI00177E9BF0|nr:hypothetical protein [Klebsiella variicola]MBD8860474.1 hypothetical protein [Klebsiella variicola]HBS2504750.1 hypothetical protein [Klebsiella variicola subsp. variicola]HBZ7667101.1 hypothetical protein [Klebsiella variicola subsp. variicola]
MNKQTRLASLGWLTLFFEAAERCALYPISMEMLHRFIYLANVLSPLSKVKMPNEYTLKHRRGPYFPQAQYDIGILVAQRVIEATDISVIQDEYGFWLKGNYRITKYGLSITDKINEQSILENYSFFLREFFGALSLLHHEEILNINSYEIHYKAVEDGQGVDISIPDNNYTRYAVSKLFPTSRLQTPREGIHRYISYLINTLHLQEENYHED